MCVTDASGSHAIYWCFSNRGTIEDALRAAVVAFDYVRLFEGQPVPDNGEGSSGLIVMGGGDADYTARWHARLTTAAP